MRGVPPRSTAGSPAGVIDRDTELTRAGEELS